MNSSRLTTLFSSEPASDSRPGSMMVSVVAHGVVSLALLIGLKMTARIEVRPRPRRYVVRMLTLNTTTPPLHWQQPEDPAHADSHPAGRPAGSSGQVAPTSSPHPGADRFTLLQPNAPPDAVLPLATPIPLVVMLSPENVPVSKIVPLPPKDVTATDVRPSLSLPNRETRMADLKISRTTSVTEKLAIEPSTTVPIEMSGRVITHVPETASSVLATAAPATIVSVSNLVVKVGTIALPLANAYAAAPISPSLAAGRQTSNNTPESSGTKEGRRNGKGTGNNPGAGVQQAAGNKPGSGNKSDSGNNANSGNKGGTGDNPAQQGAISGGNAVSSAGSLPGVQLTTTRIDLPKDGRFGVVVVGGSLAEQYPEASATWADRLAYTVYLHVGAARNWILQYSTPAAVEVAGNTGRPDAPWPYLIVRPNFDPADQGSDAILVHGLINANGRFEQLAVVFPPQFPQTKFVLNSLQQWQFRPASQNGKSAAVEVLLIIPDESD